MLFRSGVQGFEGMLEVEGIETYRSKNTHKRVYYEYHIRVNKKKYGLSAKELYRHLKNSNLPCGLPRYPLLHEQPIFKLENRLRYFEEDRDLVLRSAASVKSLPNTEELALSHIRLPVFLEEDETIAARYATVINQLFNGVG